MGLKEKGKEDKSKEQDLTRLKKKEILRLMVLQGEEIDRLKQRVAELEKELEENRIEKEQAGSIAEASLAVTRIFEEADKAAAIYLENIRRNNE